MCIVSLRSLIPLQEARSDFQTVTRHIDENGIAVLIEDNRPAYIIMNFMLFLNNYGVVDEDNPDDYGYSWDPEAELSLPTILTDANGILDAAIRAADDRVAEGYPGTANIMKDGKPLYILMAYSVIKEYFFDLEDFDTDAPKDRYEELKACVKRKLAGDPNAYASFEKVSMTLSDEEIERYGLTEPE